MDLQAYCNDLGHRARAASRSLATARGAAKNRWLNLAADALRAQASAILEANAKDVDAAKKAGLAAAQIDRLTLTTKRLEGMAQGLREVAALANPVGRVLSSNIRPNG